MKKLLSLLLITAVTLGANAQDKKFQIGLVTGGTFSWIKTQTSEIERNGIGAGFTIGIGGNYLFNENIGLASGVQFDIESFKVNYGDAVTSSVPSGDVFYAYTDTEIKKYKDGVIEDFNDTTAFELLTRKYRGKYVTIPFFLKFQTNMIGQFKYYGKFGLRTSILAGVRMDDQGYEAAYDQSTQEFTRLGNSQVTQTDMKPVSALKGLTPIRLGIGVYGGAEWNFTGNTHLYLEGGFNYGVTPSMQIESTHLVNQIDDGAGTITTEPLDIKNNPQHIIEIKLGLLF
ncbi:MAG: outer membrane beta-barrel protein [Crocinitomicaceae bacterium]|nr:outer membrane beta-barrel protein [Crocinitomicaceae bacterium]